MDDHDLRPVRHPGLSIRRAGPADASTVRWLDDLAFPEDDPVKQRADPGELEAGVDAGDVTLLELSGRPVGYVHADRGVAGRIYVAGVGIVPEVQRQGLGTLLVRECLVTIDGRTRATVPIVTVTSPANFPMLRVLFRHGFSARSLVPDFFGPGRHRFALQLRTAPAVPGAGRRSRWVRADRLSQVGAALSGPGTSIRGLAERGGVPCFEVVEHHRDDFPGEGGVVIPYVSGGEGPGIGPSVDMPR